MHSVTRLIMATEMWVILTKNLAVPKITCSEPSQWWMLFIQSHFLVMVTCYGRPYCLKDCHLSVCRDGFIGRRTLEPRHWMCWVGSFTPWLLCPHTHCIGDLVGPGVGLGALEKGHVCYLCRKSNHGATVIQSVCLKGLTYVKAWRWPVCKVETYSLIEINHIQ